MNGRELKQFSQRVDAALDAVRAADDSDAQERAEALARALLDLYGAGLARIVELAGEDALRALADDELVSGLLLLHDLHPDSVDTRIQAALDRVRPYLGSHAGGVEYLGVDAAEVAHLRLEGSCEGCPSSSVTVRLTVEQAVLEAAPEVQSVDVVGMVTESGPALLQIGLRPGLEHTPAESRPAGDWVPLDQMPGSQATVVVSAGRCRLLVANLGGTAYAYLDRCPGCSGSLETAVLGGDVLTCPGCAARYDVRLAGRGVGSPRHLSPVPVLPDGAGWKVAALDRVPVG